MPLVASTSPFYELAECDYVGWINCEPIDHVVISFYYGTKEADAIYNVYAYLLGARLVDVDIKCEPHFAALLSIDDQYFHEKPFGFQKLVRFNLEEGRFSVFYESVSFNRNKKVLYTSPEERRR